MEKKDNIIYAVCFNGYGVSGVMKMYWDDELKSWWSRSGNDDVPSCNGLGYRRNRKDKTVGYFASPDKEKVKAFHTGYKACHDVIGGWFIGKS